MVEPCYCWDGVANGIVGDEEYESLLSILDFPMESLEGDGLVGDLGDSGRSQWPGTTPCNMLMARPPSPRHVGPPYMFPELVTSAVGAPETKKLTGFAEEASGSNIIQQNNFAKVQDSGVSQTLSPISVLESSGSCSAGKSLPTEAHVTIPVRTRSKRGRTSGVNPWLAISPLPAPTSACKKISNARKEKESKKSSRQKVENSVKLSGFAELQSAAASNHPVGGKKCTHCEVTKTPQWREGPLGPKTLCNACGVRYRSGRLFPEYRPAASPAFVPSLHSNSHKKVIEMRSRAKQLATKLEEPPISPQPEFVPMSSYLFDIY